LKLQPCMPGSVDGRDAILLADRINYGGANQELIWRAFARRGLGVNAKQGLSYYRFDQVENFDLPAAYLCTIPLTVAAVQSSTVNTGGVATNLYLGYGPQSVMLQASGDATNVYTWSGNGVAGLSATNIANPVFTATTAGTYTFTVKAVNDALCTKYATITIRVTDVRCGPKKNKVTVCHNGVALCINSIDVQSHLSHGCRLGDCTTNVSASTDANSELKVAEKEEFILSYPNPFSESTTISFKARESGHTVLKVYDITGREVETLFEGDAQSGATYNYNFKPVNRESGVYIYKIINGNTTRSGTMLLMK
jgi:extracellular elastinolytic metalloproteinase